MKANKDWFAVLMLFATDNYAVAFAIPPPSLLGPLVKNYQPESRLAQLKKKCNTPQDAAGEGESGPVALEVAENQKISGSRRYGVAAQ
jgi:hypothetical protein